jgi:nitrilase
MEKFKIAIIQEAPVFLNTLKSIKKAGPLIKDAAENGAQIIAFPETWLPGYPVWLDFAPKAASWDYAPAKELYRILVENAISVGDAHFKQLQHFAKEYQCYLVIGVHELCHQSLYNSMIFLDRNGKDYWIHRKLMPTYTEKLIWGQGDGSGIGVLNTDLGVLGGLICWEHWMPLARAAMHTFGELVHVAQWPAVKDLHQLASAHYAFESQCFVMAAGTYLKKSDVMNGATSLPDINQETLDFLDSMDVGTSGIIHSGGSAIIGPDSQYLAEPVFNKSETIIKEINPEKVIESRMAIETSGHYARPDIFKLEVDRKPQTGVTFKDQELKKDENDYWNCYDKK